MSDSCMDAWFFVTPYSGCVVADFVRQMLMIMLMLILRWSYMHETGTCGVGTEARLASTPLISCVPVEFN